MTCAVPPSSRIVAAIGVTVRYDESTGRSWLSAPPDENSDNSDVRRSRNYAMQPRVVPHKIDGYQLDKNANRCMFCHSRSRTQESQAPMISVTHFIGRDGNFLAELSPRRYFCLQCHVPQVPQDPLIENRFIDVDQLLYGAQAGSSGQPPRQR